MCRTEPRISVCQISLSWVTPERSRMFIATVSGSNLRARPILSSPPDRAKLRPVSKDWEDEAENWVRWARTPGHDVYELYSSVFFEELLLLPESQKSSVDCASPIRAIQGEIDNRGNVRALTATIEVSRRARLVRPRLT
jgi:hypothetical protein